MLQLRLFERLLGLGGFSRAGFPAIRAGLKAAFFSEQIEDLSGLSRPGEITIL